jgi:predicted permease
MLDDLRYALRMLVKSPITTGAALLSLALGLGANSAIFALIKAVFLQPVPVARPAELVALYTRDSILPGTQNTSYQNYLDYRRDHQVFSGLLAYLPIKLNLWTAGDPIQVDAALVSGDYFDVLGVRPARGRAFRPDEDATPGSHPVAVLGYGLWQRRFGADPGVVGRTLLCNGRAFTVVGIAPRGFGGSEVLHSIEVFVPMMMYDQVLTGPRRAFFLNRGALTLKMIGRLKPGVRFATATAAIETMARRLEREYPDDNQGRGITLLPFAESTISPWERQTYVLAGTVLGATVGLLLLIAAANVANLLLARALSRRKEISIRLALGAGKGRLTRQLLTESTVLTLLGAGLGLVLAAWGRTFLWSLRPPNIPGSLDVSLDLRVLLFTFVVALATGLASGLAPVSQIFSPALVRGLKGEGTAQRGGGGRRLKNALVVGQVALSVVALVIAGLFLRSLWNAQRIDPGFAADHLLSVSFNVGAQGYDETRGRALYERVVARARTVPGVRAAALGEWQVLKGMLPMRPIGMDGIEVASKQQPIYLQSQSVGPGYFETVGIPILHGRGFDGADRGDSRPVVVINETMAGHFWPGQDALGKRFTFLDDNRTLAVVGIARNSKYNSLGEGPVPFAYLPVGQRYAPGMTLYARTAGSPAALLETVRKEVQALDRGLPIADAVTIAGVLRESLWSARLGAILLSIFGLLGLILAGVGIYGVMTHHVEQRRREIGIRMALGARSGDVVRLVLLQAMALVGIGIVLGLAGAVATTRLLTRLLFGVGGGDLPTFAVTVAVLTLLALAASFLPARRASGIDPYTVLKG